MNEKLESDLLSKHYIGASGCDGSILGFLSSRENIFKYSSARNLDFLAIYKILLKVTANPSKENLNKLNEYIEQIELVYQKAIKDIDEAELCMNTIKNVFLKIDSTIKETEKTKE